LTRKYCATSRFFDEGLIRFTQPGALNDPDEARPVIIVGKYSPEDYARARTEAKRSGYNRTSDADLEVFLRPFPNRRYDEKNFPGLWPATEPRLRKEPFATLDEMDLAVAERATELCMIMANKTVGILSLSNGMDEPMWAHYAANHTGLAICFDEDHSFFKAARPVIYTDTPIHVSANSGWVRLGGRRWNNEDILDSHLDEIPDELFFRKRLGWSSEREWRMIYPLRDAANSAGIDSNGYVIYLFKVPPSAVKSVIFGYRAAASAVQETLTSTHFSS